MDQQRQEPGLPGGPTYPAPLQPVSTTMLPRLLTLVWALPLVMAGADDGPGDQAFK